MSNDKPQPMFNSEEMSDLKRLAVAGLLSGSAAASLKYLRPGALFGSKPQVIGSPFVEVPVPGQEPLPNTSEFFEKIRKQKNVGKGKRLQTFKPGARVAIEDSGEKQAFSYESLYNMAYLPAAALSLIAPAIGSYHLLNKLHKNRVKQDHIEELDDAKKEFGQALVESHSNRLNKPVVVDNSPQLGKAASSHEPTLAEDLEKLASLYLDKKPKITGLKKQAKTRYTEAADTLLNTISLPLQGIGSGLRYLGAAVSDPEKSLKAYGNILGGLAVGGGLIGATTGYRDAIKNDEEKLQSEKYLNEFLARRHNEGMPVQSIPVPVKQVGKRLVARPVNAESTEQ